MADYANDVKSKKKIEQRNKTADFQLHQYTDRLSIERRRKSRDLDRERRMFAKRYMSLRSAVKNVRRYSDHVTEERDIVHGNIRRANNLWDTLPTRAVKSAAPRIRGPELEMYGEDVMWSTSTAPQGTSGGKVFITQRSVSKQGRRTTPALLGADEEDEYRPEEDIDTWSNAARDIRGMAGPEVIKRVERNNKNGPRNLDPPAAKARPRALSVHTPRKQKKRPVTSIEGTLVSPNSEFSYRDFTLKRPDNTEIVPKHVEFIKLALARTKTPLLPVHDALGVGRPKPERNTLAPPETTAH